MKHERRFFFGALIVVFAVLAFHTAEAQSVRASKSTIAFGNQTVFVTKTDSFYVKNDSTVAISITAVTNTKTAFVPAAKVGSLTPTIQPADSFWYYVNFTADAVGAVADTVVITHNGLTNNPIKIAVSGTGVNDVRLYNPATGGQYTTSFTFVRTVAGAARLDSITIRNLNATNSIDVTAMSFTNPKFTTVTSLPQTIPAADSFMFYLSYNSPVMAIDFDTLTVVHTGAAANSSPIKLRVNATAASNLQFYTNIGSSNPGVAIGFSDTLTINGTTANATQYGTRNGSVLPPIPVDSAKTARIQVRNVGAGAIRLDSVRLNGPHFTVPSLYQIPEGGISLRPGDAYDRYYTFTFQPHVLSSSLLDTFYLYHADTVLGSNPLTIAVRGASQNKAYVTDAGTGSSLAFGAVPFGATKDLIIRIHNYRDTPLTIDSVRLVVNDPHFTVFRPFLSVIPAGVIDTMIVRWTSAGDTSATVKKDTVYIYAPAAFASTVKFPMSGNVVRSIVFAPSGTINFNEVTVTTIRDTTLKVYNRTDQDFTLTKLNIAGGFSSNYSIRSNMLNEPLLHGDSATIELRFEPSVIGTITDTLIISHNVDTTVTKTNPFRIVLTGRGVVGGIDPANYLTVDNIQGPDGIPIHSADSTYWETGSFWNNAGGASYGAGHRRSPNLAGSGAGSYARYTFTVDTSAPYLVYHYCVNSPNVGQNQLFFMEKGGLSGIYDSLRYNLQDHVTGVLSIPLSYGGTWLPLKMYYIFGLGKGAAQVTIGSDAVSGSFLRVDAVRLLRSQLKADIEFGRRDIGFTSVRVPEEFPATTIGEESLLRGKPYRLYNLGSDTLVITGIDFFPAGGSSRSVPWFEVKNVTFPLRIPPMTISGNQEKDGYKDIDVVFAPYQEGSARDSMVIHSNDPNEPNAYILLHGDAFNINFIMNASIGNTEPHYRAPGPPDVPTSPLYYETSAGSWLSSTASNFPYPIPGGNSRSRVNIGDFSVGPHQAFYKFELPEVYNGKIQSAGQYILEYSGPITSNAATASRVYVTNLMVGAVPPDSVIDFNQNKSAPTIWMQIGGSTKTFALYPGAATLVEFTRYSGIGTGYHRVDLLRVRKVPTGALIGVNVNTAIGDSLYFGEVNFRDPAGPLGKDNQKVLAVRSIGESQLVITSIRFRQGTNFSLVGAPPVPFYMKALIGQLDLTVQFTPDKIAPRYRDTLEIVSNSTRDSLLLVPLSGVGIGGIFYLDDDGQFNQVVYSQPAFGGQYVGGWDPANMNKWQLQAFTGTKDSVVRGLTRRLLAIYQNPTGFFEWYPSLPTEAGTSDSMYAEVLVTMGSSLTKASPAAHYTVYNTGGARFDTVITQNGRAAGPNGIYATVSLGRFYFLRGGRDVAGSNQPIFGYIRLQNDTAAVSAQYPAGTPNAAKRDTFALHADAIIIRELPFQKTSPSVGVTDNAIPDVYSLSQNYPNPFNPTTTIRFSVPERVSVELKVFDLLGREVRTLIRGDQMNPGNYQVVWDGRNSVNKPVATGVYFYRITAGGFTLTKKMVLLK